MFTLVAYFLRTRNNYYALFFLYPFLMTLAWFSGEYIRSAFELIEIVAYPIVFYGLYFNFEKARLERLPLSMKEINYSRDIALYMLMLALFAEKLILLSFVDSFNLYSIAKAIFEINVFFGLGMLVTEFVLKKIDYLNIKSVLTFSVEVLPLLAYVVVDTYLISVYTELKIALGFAFFPALRYWINAMRTR